MASVVLLFENIVPSIQPSLDLEVMILMPPIKCDSSEHPAQKEPAGKHPRTTLYMHWQ